MKKNLNLSEGFSAHVDIEDLENLGWNFDDIYESVARAKRETGMYSDEITIEEMESAEQEEKENYHIRLYNNGQGMYWIPSHNESGDVGDGQWCGDEEQTKIDIQHLYNEGLLWEVFEGEEIEGLGNLEQVTGELNFIVDNSSLHRCALTNEEKAFCYENKEGKLFVTFLVIDDILREDFNLQVNYCPTCGYKAKNLIK
jgi:hypothetical protein